jgi:endonuclease/exonuclease/phosphatase family metal-dependent hydrolase
MAANITSGTQQSYEAAGIRIFQGLAPDVVLIQEFRYATGTLRSLVDTAFGAGFGYYVEPRTTGIPNGIVSRYPILDSGTWVDSNVSDRAYAWARIDVPGPTDLWAVSLHLLTTGASQRDAEAQELVKDIQGKIPAGDYLVVGGDLNTDATNEPALLDLASVVTLAAPFPADQLGNNNSSTNRNRPHDWVLASPGLHAREVPVVLGSSTYPSGLVFDTRVYTPLTDVMPILAGDSAVSGMQHMPVVREFTVESPAEAGTGTDAGPSDAGLDAADTGSE